MFKADEVQAKRSRTAVVAGVHSLPPEKSMTAFTHLRLVMPALFDWHRPQRIEPTPHLFPSPQE